MLLMVGDNMPWESEPRPGFLTVLLVKTEAPAVYKHTSKPVDRWDLRL